MSQVAVVSEVYVPELVPVVDVPCPVCGVCCPNDLYCVNCGYVHDPVMKKYQTPEQLIHEKQMQKEIEEKRRQEAEAKQKRSKHHAKIFKIGREFKQQNGNGATVGDIVRRKKQDGSYDKTAHWYIKTQKGWTRSPTKTRKPTIAQIKRVCTS